MSRLCRLKTKTHGEDGQWAYEEITKLREQVAEQSAVIEKLQAVCDMWLWETVNERHRHPNARKLTQETLSIPTDSTQILDEVRRAERERVYQVADNACATEHVLLAIRAME